MTDAKLVERLRRAVKAIRGRGSVNAEQLNALVNLCELAADKLTPQVCRCGPTDGCAVCSERASGTQGRKVTETDTLRAQNPDECPAGCGIPLSEHPPGPPCPPNSRWKKQQTCRHQYWDLGYCIDCGIHANRLEAQP